MATEWPRLSDYNAAFHNPEKGLIPLELKRASVARNGFGSPDPLSGGFAYIYRLTLPDGTQKAVRVFIQEDPVRDSRIPWVVKRLEESKLQFPALKDVFLPCHWIDPAVHTSRADVPALLMDWSEGQTLGEWLRKQRGNPTATLEFRERFFRMIELLEQAGISHGDLQTGNILVNKDGHPVLVDYDGVAFYDEPAPPPLQGGHPNFQHPLRSIQLASAQLDKFPAITIDLGLLAWSHFSKSSWFLSLVSDSDRLYFFRSDFLFPDNSEAFGRLREHPQLATAAKELEALCKGDPANVPTLAEFRSRAYPLEVKLAPFAVEQSVSGEQSTHRGDVHEVTKPEGRRKGKAWKETETTYLPVFPLYSALNVAGLRARAGEMVEVIGKITEIHEGETKYGDPYVFVNFMDWRESLVFHLVAWSEDLDELTEAPNEDWVGKWIQVTGLLEEPYIRKSYSDGMVKQVRYSIRLRQDQQFRFLSPQQAKVRLKAATGGSYLLEEPSALSNQELLKHLQALSPTPPASSLTPTTPRSSGLGKPASPGRPTVGSGTKGPWVFWIILLGLIFYLFSLLDR